jgi:hypothetical protein
MSDEWGGEKVDRARLDRVGFWKVDAYFSPLKKYYSANPELDLSPGYPMVPGRWRCIPYKSRLCFGRGDKDTLHLAQIMYKSVLRWVSPTLVFAPTS